MRFLELVEKRSSIRQYASTEVEREKIDYILETARLAPSAVNRQPWLFILVKEEEGKKKIRACYDREWFKEAPCYLIACGDHVQSWKRGDGKDHMDIDVSIAVEHICLAAAEQGLGTCWVCNFNADSCRELFHIPENMEPVALIPLGYPASSGEKDEAPKRRKPIDEIVKKESF